MQTCGYCDGTGQTETRPYDSEGRVNDGPGIVPCEYCDGVGVCEEGSKLLPAAKPRSTVTQ